MGTFNRKASSRLYVPEENGNVTQLVFTSEAIENIALWRAGETYLILNNDEFIERFELAEPGKDFSLYSKAHLKRIKPTR